MHEHLRNKQTSRFSREISWVHNINRIANARKRKISDPCACACASVETVFRLFVCAYVCAWLHRLNSVKKGSSGVLEPWNFCRGAKKPGARSPFSVNLESGEKCWFWPNTTLEWSDGALEPEFSVLEPCVFKARALEPWSPKPLWTLLELQESPTGVSRTWN